MPISRRGPRTAHIGALRNPAAGDRDRREPINARDLARSLFAEAIGSFALTFIAAGTVMVGAISHGEVGFVAQVVAPGLVVMALIYSIGDASGAHYNPAVTLGFTLRGLFPASRVPYYWAVQVLGGVLAAATLRGVLGNIAHLGATLPQGGVIPAFVMEVIATFIYVVSNLGTATRYSNVGPDAAVARGAVIAVDGLIAGPISGASMNPQRSLGPMIVGGDLGYAWLYIVAPFLGAMVAVAAMSILHVKDDPNEMQASEGRPTRTAGG